MHGSDKTINFNKCVIMHVVVSGHDQLNSMWIDYMYKVGVNICMYSDEKI